MNRFTFLATLCAPLVAFVKGKKEPQQKYLYSCHSGDTCPSEKDVSLNPHVFRTESGLKCGEITWHRRNGVWTSVAIEYNGENDTYDGTYTKYIDGKLIGIFKIDAG